MTERNPRGTRPEDGSGMTVRWMFLGVIVLAACATPVKLAGKLTWSAVKLGTGLAWKVASGIGRIGAKETVHAIDLTADAALALAARRESQVLVETFWTYMRQGAFPAAYNLFSDSLKRSFKKHDFYDYAKGWAPTIAGFEIVDAGVHQFHVEVPTQVSIREGDSASEIRVQVYVSKIKTGWRITGWEGPGGPEKSSPR